MNATIIFVNHRKPLFVVTSFITSIILPSQPMSIQMLKDEKDKKNPPYVGRIVWI